MGSELDNELFHKFLKLLFGGVKFIALVLRQIHSSSILFFNQNQTKMIIPIFSLRFEYQIKHLILYGA